LYAPDLFKLHNLGDWHKALTHFQKVGVSFYDFFQNVKNNPMNILHIGMKSKHIDIRYIKNYFPNSTIYACDEDDTILFQEERIVTFYLDQHKPRVIQRQLCDKNIEFDIIIDYGLESFETRWKTLKILFDKLTKTGTYVIRNIGDGVLDAINKDLFTKTKKVMEHESVQDFEKFITVNNV